MLNVHFVANTWIYFEIFTSISSLHIFCLYLNNSENVIIKWNSTRQGDCLYGCFNIKNKIPSFSKQNTYYLIGIFNRSPMEYAPQPSGLIAFIDKTVVQRIYDESWINNPNIFFGVLNGCQPGGHGHLRVSRSSCYVTFILITKFITTSTYTSLLWLWLFFLL